MDGMQGAQDMRPKQDMQNLHARMQERDQVVRMMVADRREMHQQMQEHMKRMEQGGCAMPGRATGE